MNQYYITRSLAGRERRGWFSGRPRHEFPFVRVFCRRSPRNLKMRGWRLNIDIKMTKRECRAVVTRVMQWCQPLVGRVITLWTEVKCITPFTRYNRFDNRLYRVNGPYSFKNVRRCAETCFRDQVSLAVFVSDIAVFVLKRDVKPNQSLAVCRPISWSVCIGCRKKIKTSHR